jgi:nucleoside-diphosphate-sugar epimerase
MVTEQQPKALVTGDRGFLGRHFKEELKARGYEVHGMDIQATISQDCRNLFALERRHPSVRKHWDLVVHCAAVVGGRAAIENSPLDTAESLAIDAEMFRWASVVRPGRVLYFSSSAAYPVHLQMVRGLKLQEDDVWGRDGLIDPDEIYGWSKVTGELLAGRLRKAGVPVTVVRPFSGYGADQDDTYPFRAILERVRRREDPVELWCGDCTRDWVHVSDVVAGALAVAADGTEAPVNLCTGRPVSFVQLARIMTSAAGYEPPIHMNPEAPQGVLYRVGDPRRMLSFYTPKVTLEDAVREALKED